VVRAAKHTETGARGIPGELLTNATLAAFATFLL